MMHQHTPQKKCIKKNVRQKIFQFLTAFFFVLFFMRTANNHSEGWSAVEEMNLQLAQSHHPIIIRWRHNVVTEIKKRITKLSPV